MDARWICGWVLIGAGAVGCGDDAASPDGGMPLTCEPDAPVDFTGIDRTRGALCPPAAAWIVGVTGRVVDESGAPVRCARPQLCIRVSGTENVVCLMPPTTGDDGEFSILVPELNRCAIRAAMRVRIPGTDTGTTYCHVDLSAPVEGIADVPQPYVMVATERATSLPPLGDEALERPVEFADGLELVVTPGEIGLGGEYASLAARHLAPGAAPTCMLDGAPAFRGLWAFSSEAPVDLAGGFPVRIPNEAGVAGGTDVELWLIGGLNTRLVDGTAVEESTWVRFGTGTVSSDGSRIESEDGAGLPYLSWMGWL